MPAERARMRKVREVLSLRHALGLSERQIAVSVGVSRSTVAEYLRRAGVVGITWPVPEEMLDAELECRLPTPPSFEPKPWSAKKGLGEGGGAATTYNLITVMLYRIAP